MLKCRKIRTSEIAVNIGRGTIAWRNVTMAFEMLLSPMKIGTMTVKNRVVMTAAAAMPGTSYYGR